MFKQSCLLDPNAMQPFPFPALFSKGFSLGFNEAFPAATLWFQSFIYARQHQECRETALSCQTGLQGQQPAPQVCSEGLARVLSTILGTGSLMVHVVPASDFTGLSNTKFLESQYLL